MALNIALKRAKKAQRRKQVVAKKRKLEVIESSTGYRARKAAGLPIRHCLMHGELAGGMVTVILARGLSPHRLTAAVFLVDTYCLGIKDVCIREMSGDEFEVVTTEMGLAAPLSDIDLAYARKLLRDSAAWAASIGFKPHRDFVGAEQIFGDVDAGFCTSEFEFGKDGKPFYLPGPTETGAKVRQRLTHLFDAYGPDQFESVVALSRCLEP